MNVLRMFANFYGDLFSGRKLIYDLTVRDFKAKYLGSYLGIFWAFLHPAITILVFWFVFQVGFRTVPVDNYPYVLWLMSGIFPWFFFSESFSAGTNTIVDNSFLVKKVVFRVSVLPIIKICSSLVIHIFFIGVLFFILLAYGYKPNIYYLQFFYYLFGLTLLVLGLTWLSSAIYVYFRDLGQIVAIFIQLGFWITPIFWSFNIIPSQYQMLFKLNPVFYIVEGYRSTFVYRKWFWEEPTLTLYFWVFTITVLIVGSLVFRRLRPHFSDVL